MKRQKETGIKDKAIESLNSISDYLPDETLLT